ncbi:MAG: hypothetical protein R3256_02580 [Thalassovita sp.]|nr:hypothetical protein [Thalassovita sp.]
MTGESHIALQGKTAVEPITCNAICSGYVLTPLVEAQITGTTISADGGWTDLWVCDAFGALPPSPQAAPPPGYL